MTRSKKKHHWKADDCDTALAHDDRCRGGRAAGVRAEFCLSAGE